jgi:hypothetical protein
VKRHLPWIAAVLVAVVVATWPLAVVVGSAAVGHPYGDMADHYWGTWWFGRELLLGKLPLHTDVSHFPDALSLWYVDPLGALLALPLRVFGFPAAWNLLLFLQVGLGAVTAYAVGADMAEDRSAGLVSAMVVGVSPFVLGLLHSGLSEFLNLAPVTLYCWLLLRTVGLDPRGRPRPAWGIVGCAALLALCGVASLYYLIFGALLALSTLSGAGWRERLPIVARIGIGAAFGVAPAALVSLSTLGGAGAVTAANAPGWSARLPATDVLTFFHPGAYYFPDTPANGNPGILHVNYLGWVALVLAAGAIRRPLTRAGLVYGAFALGPRLAFAKQVIVVAGQSVLLPLGLLCFPGSPLGWVHQPYRMVAFLMPVLGIAAALGAARLPARIRPLLALAVLAETLFVSPAVWPLPTRPMTPPAALLALDPGPILDWPPDASTSNRDYLLWATQHGQPVPYGVNVFLGEKLRRDPLVDALLRALTKVEARARNRDVPFEGRLLQRPKGTQTRLGALGFAHVVVHKDALDEREWGRTRSLLEGAFGPAASEDPTVAVWAVR